MRTALGGLIALAAASAAQAEPLEWASPAQRDLISRLASAIASVEPCGGDLNRDRLAAIVKSAFGPTLTPPQTADVLYAITTAQAVQGVQIRDMSAHDRRERCEEFRKHFGPSGTDLKGVLR